MFWKSSSMRALFLCYAVCLWTSSSIAGLESNNSDSAESTVGQNHQILTSLFKKFNLKVNKLSVKLIDENDPSEQDVTDDPTAIDIDLAKFIDHKIDQSIFDWLEQGQFGSVREIRHNLRTKLGKFISTGCLADLLYFADEFLDYVLARNDLSSFCRKNDSIDCHCSDRTQSAIDTTSWTLDVLDSFGKLPSGLAKGNLWMLGDYEQCTGISIVKGSSRHVWQGRYSRIDLFPFKDNMLRTFVEEDHKSLFAGIDGGQHAIQLPSQMPNCNVFLHFKFGTCFPDTCSKADIQTIVQYLVNIPQKITGKQLICSSDVHCHAELDIRKDLKAIILLVFLLVIFSLTVFGTCYDYKVHRKHEKRYVINVWSTGKMIEDKTQTPLKEIANQIETLGEDRHPYLIRFLLSFSVYTNGKKIFNMKAEKATGHISCLHGIKALSMFWVLLAHTYSCALLYLDNPLDALAMVDKISNFVILNASLAVDAFFVMSGLLLAYLWCKEMKKSEGKSGDLRNPKEWLIFYLHRYIRLTPLYAIVLAIDIVLVKYLNDGPMWNQNGLEPPVCNQHWWSNLLYVNNFVSTECMVWSWYLANDMQFFVLSIPILALLWTSQIAGLILIVSLILGSSIIRGVLIVSNDAFPPISVLFNDIEKIQFIEDFTRDVYVKPYCRCGPFFIGLLLGYVLYKRQLSIAIPKWLNIIGWLSTTAVGLGVLFGIYDFSRTGTMPVVSKFIYGAFCRVLWAAFIAYAILACATGHGGPVNRFLSLNVWKPFSRLVYSAYLIHPMLILITYSSFMRPIHYMGVYHSLLFSYFGHVLLTFFCAFWLTCALEIPMQRLEHLHLRKRLSYHKLKSCRNVTVQELINNGENSNNNVSDGPAAAATRVT